MYFAFYYTIVTRTRIKIDNVSRTLYFIEKWCTVYIPTLQPHSNKINKRKEVVEDTDLNNYPD